MTQGYILRRRPVAVRTTARNTDEATSLLVDELAPGAPDTALANHPDVWWYPDLTSWDSTEGDLLWEGGYYGYAPTTWPKVFFATDPEFGIPAMRFESQSSGPPDTRTLNGQTPTVGIAIFYKYLWEGTRVGLAAPAVQDVAPITEVWFRYCIMLESSVYSGFNETGMKLPGLSGQDHTGPVYDRGFHSGMHHSAPGELAYSPPYNPITQPIDWQNYYWGIDTDHEVNERFKLPVKKLEPDRWYVVEQHVRMNTIQTPSGDANADGLVDTWIDGELVLSYHNVKLRHFPDWNAGYPPEVQRVYGLVYHGGQNSFPVKPIHYRLTGVCLAKRRIGIPPRMSALALTAKNLAVGEWAQVTPSPSNGAVLTARGASPETIFANSGCWDPVEGKMNFICKTASTFPYIQLQYSELNNAWSSLQTIDTAVLAAAGHAYDGNSFDVRTGRLYFKPYGTGIREIYYADRDAGYTWSTSNKLAQWPSGGAGGNSPGLPTFLWEGEMTGAGKLGVLCACELALEGGTGPNITAKVEFYDIESATWLSGTEIAIPGGAVPSGNLYLSVSERWAAYSRVLDCAVISLIDLASPTPNRFWFRVNSDRSVTLLTAAAPVAAGGYENFANTGNVIADPVTGKFLVLGYDNGSFYELDPAGTGTWTALTGSRTPPANLQPINQRATISFELPQYGVVAYFDHEGEIYLYRHSV